MALRLLILVVAVGGRVCYKKFGACLDCALSFVVLYVLESV